MADSNAETVKERTDLVALISESLPLKRAGSYYKARCPFHEEDTPSFMVSPSRQLFHCYGCGKSGDAFSWLMEREGMSFPEALRVLAQRAGVRLTFERAERREERERLRGTLELAAVFYHRILAETAAGEAARAYLTRRGFTTESLGLWRVGFCPEEATGMVSKAAERGVTEQDLVRAGVLHEGRGRLFEFFHGRILFPLADVHGSVVGLAGRVLATEDPGTPKYLNTPETVLYRKSTLLYGLDRAKEAIRKEDFAVLVEGYTDVIASHAAGVTLAVATAGTALTDAHLRLLRRFTGALAFAFDADAAGSAATRRALDLALAEGFHVSVVVLPSEKDPAELAVADPAAWRAAVKSRQAVFPFLLQRATAARDVTTSEGKQAVAGDLLPIIARVRDRVVAGDYANRLAAALGVDPRFLYDELRRYEPERETARRKRGFAAAATAPPDEEAGFQKRTLRVDAAVAREERLLQILLREVGLIPAVRAHLPETVLAIPHARALYADILAWYARGHGRGSDAVPTVGELRAGLAPDLKTRLDALLVAAETDAESSPEALRAEVELLVRELLRSRLRGDLRASAASLRDSVGGARRDALQRVVALTAELARVDRLRVTA